MGPWPVMKPMTVSCVSKANVILFCRSHMDMEDDDPTLGDKFSTATLQHDAGAGTIPSAVHGAPSTAAESREVLARLKRMAGFESQDFDPAVLI